MSTGLVNNDAITDALQRAKELAASSATIPTLKRTIEEDSSYPAKRPNNGGGMDSMGGLNISTLGMPMGMPNFGAPMQGANENVVETITVPDSTVGLVIGKGGEQITQIQTQSGARVQMSPESEGNGVRQCTLQGSKMAVERAKQLIHEVISRASNRMTQSHSGPGGGDGGRSVTYEMLIPGTKCGLIIGKQGETIKMLQETSGVKMVMIQESQEATGQPKPLRMTGDPEKIEHAKRLIQEVLNSREDGSNPVMSRGPGGGGGGNAKGEVVVPRASVGMIIGKGGETIKRLAMETGTKIQFKPDEDPSTNDRCAIIMGTREQIYKATELITELVQKSCQQGGGNQQQEESIEGFPRNFKVFFMHVPANKTGLVIGKGGETIKQICTESGAHCELSRDPPPNSSEKVFIIKGSQYQIHHAQHIIRIKVGDIPPGTPVPHFGGGGAPMAGNMFGGGGGAPFNGAQFGAPAMGNQWNNSFGAQSDASNGWAAAQQQPFYGQQPAGHQPAAFGGMQQYAAAGAQPQQFAAAGQTQAAAQTGNAAPAINPQTGQPDYSAQWAEYYRSMGMHEQAAKIDAQMKMTQGGGAQTTQAAAVPTQAGGIQQPMGGQQFSYGQSQPGQQPQQAGFAFTNQQPY